MTPVEFLQARLDEREAIARAAIGTAAFQKQTGRWSFEKVADPYGHIPIVFALADGGGKTQAADMSTAWESDERGAFIAANDPAYVLADIAAKRAILAEHHTVESAGRVFCSCCGLAELGMAPFAPCRTVRLLCQPFADHPDYEDLRWAA